MQIIKAYSTFNELEKTLDSDQKRQFLSDRAVKILKNDECWDFNKMKFGDKEAGLFKVLKTAFILELRLNNNKRPQIIKEISPVRYSYVKMLDLGSNKIRSIQSLDRVFMPNLQRLNLYNNQITSVKILKKCRFPHLIYLSVTSNQQIHDLENITKMKTKNFLWLWLEPKQKLVVMGQDLTWLMKTEMPKFSQLMLRCHERLENEKIMNCIQRKFPSLIMSRN